MAKRLSAKEKGFVEDFVKGETGTQAILNNYDTTSPHVAGVMAAENLAKPRIQQAIEDALPDELLNEVHREGLFATKAAWEQNNEDVWENIGEEADFASRAKYLDMAYKRRGLYAAEKQVRLTASVEVKNIEALKQLADGLLNVQRS